MRFDNIEAAYAFAEMHRITIIHKEELSHGRTRMFVLVESNIFDRNGELVLGKGSREFNIQPHINDYTGDPNFPVTLEIGRNGMMPTGRAWRIKT